MPNTEYRVSFRGDLGNLQQFISSVGTGLGRGIKQMYQASAMQPARSAMASSSGGGDLVGVRNITTSIDAYNRTITQTGTVFHKFVSGWVADVRRLDQAAATLGAKLGTGGSIYGTPASLRAGRVGIRMSDLKPKYEEFMEAPYEARPQNLALIEQAQKKLGTPRSRIITTRGGSSIAVPAMSYFEEKEALDKIRTGIGLRSEARTGSIITLGQEKVDEISKRIDKETSNLETIYKGLYKTRAKAVKNMQAMLAGGGEGISQTRWQSIFQRLQTSGLLARVASETGLDMSTPGHMMYAAGIGPESVPWDKRKPTQRVLRGEIMRELYYGDMGAPSGADIERQATQARNSYNARRERLVQEQIAVEEQVNTQTQQEAARLARINGWLGKREQNIERRWASERGYMAYAQQAPPEIPTDLATFLRSSKQFRNEFVKKMGIKSPMFTETGLFSDAFKRDIEKMGITASATHDFERGLTRLGGSVKALNGITGEYSWTLDNNNRVVQTWGRSMRGVGGFLPQVARDFQKVVEWTIATTVVFGSLAAVFGSFTKINQVNNDLQRFQITAKTTGQETEAAFKTIANVAVRTATPLTDLTAVMDDIALATRRVAQTSQEWMNNIGNLAEAVGILTNITGIDTAKGTDMLTSAYKQLGMTTGDLIPLLNKITAVAGGNAQAIQDIMQAIGGLAEAGKAAGLTVDQQIGAVQTLSQVTNKTAADTATAFKNLFGAINAPASEKRLKEFNIAIRDTEGNLRPFLDIYGDIYKAIQTGVIPQGRVQDVLRAISGGPRRAPDAAALLSNYPKIMEAIGIAAMATNEALIANAKIMETNNAKLQQLRSQFDATLIEKFTDAVNKLTAALVTIGNALSGVFGSFPDQLVSVALQLTILVSTFALVRKALGFLPKLFGNFTTSLRSVEAATVATAEAQQLLIWESPAARASTAASRRTSGRMPWESASAYRVRDLQERWKQELSREPTSRSRIPNLHSQTMEERAAIHGVYRDTRGRFVSPAAVVTRKPFETIAKLEANELVLNKGATQTLVGTMGTGFGSLFKNKWALGGALGIAGGVGLGVAGAVMGGQNGLQSAATVAQSIGIPLMMIGGPVGIAAGVALTGIGAALQVIDGAAQKSSEELFKAKSALYDNIQAMDEQARAQSFAKEAQTNSKATMERLSKITNRTAEEEKALTEARKQYVSSTFELATARQALNEKEQELLDILPQLGKEYETWIDIITSGGLTPENRAELYSKISGDILGQKGIPYFKDISEYFKGANKSSGIYGTYNNADALYKNLADTSLLVKDIFRISPEEQWREVLATLQRYGPNGTVPYGTGFQVTQEWINAALSAIANAPEEVRWTQEFLDTVNLFNTIVSEFGNIAPEVRARWAVEASRVNTAVAARTGALTGSKLTTQQSREEFAAILSSGFPERKYGVRSGREFEKTQTTIDDLSKYIEGILGGVGELTYDQVKVGFDKFIAAGSNTAQELKAAFEGATPEVMEEALRRFIELNGEGKVSVENLAEAIQGAIDEEQELTDEVARQNELRNSIRENFKSTALDLGQQMAELRAAYQSGDITYAQWAGQSKELEEYIELNEKLDKLMRSNLETTLQNVANRLSTINGLYGIQYQSVDSLNTAIIQFAQNMGLSADAIEKLKVKMRDLIKHEAALQALSKVNIEVTIKTYVDKTRLARQYGENELDDTAVAERRANDLRLDALRRYIDRVMNEIDSIFGSGDTGRWDTASGGSSASSYNKPGVIDIPEDWKTAGIDVKDYLSKAIQWAKEYQAAIPGEAKANKDEVVAIMDENKRIAVQKGIGEEYLRKAMDRLTEEIKKQNDLLAKADTISRIRIGAGDFAALANVPMNLKSGVSVGSPQGPISINLNINGQILTPAQMDQMSNMIAAALKSKIGT